MDSIETVRAFLAWCTVINFGLLIIATISLTLMRGFVTRIHASMFGLSEQQVSEQYFQYLAQFKIAVLIFNLAPYLALRIMA